MAFLMRKGPKTPVKLSFRADLDLEMKERLDQRIEN